MHMGNEDVPIYVHTALKGLNKANHVFGLLKQFGHRIVSGLGDFDSSIFGTIWHLEK